MPTRCVTSGAACPDARLACRWQSIFMAVLVFVMGSAFAFSVPAGGGLDEPMHVARVEQLAEGAVLPQRIGCEGLEESLVSPASGDYVPYGGQTDSALYELLVRGNRLVSGRDGGYDLSFPVWEDSRVSVDSKMGEGAVTWIFSNTSVNSPVSYAPYVLAYWAGTLLASSPVAVVLAMRLAGVLTLSVVTWGCMTLLPVGRWLFALVVVLPNTLSVNSMVTADLMTFALSSLYVSCLVRMLWNDCAGRLEWAVLWASLFLLCLGKVTYAPFGLLLFLLPALSPAWRSRGSLVRIGVVGLTSLAAFVTWYLLVKDINTGLMWSADIRPEEQTAFVLANPLAFLGSFVQGILGDDILTLGFYTSFTRLITTACPTALALAAVFSVDLPRVCKGRASKRFLTVFSAGVLAVALLICVLIYLALYLQFNAPGAQEVEGVQRRYFMPLVFPIYMVVLSLCQGCGLGGSSDGSEGEDGPGLVVAAQEGGDAPAIVALVLMSLMTLVSLTYTMY